MSVCGEVLGRLQTAATDKDINTALMWIMFNIHILGPPQEAYTRGTRQSKQGRYLSSSVLVSDVPGDS